MAGGIAAGGTKIFGDIARVVADCRGSNIALPGYLAGVDLPEGAQPGLVLLLVSR